MCFAARLLEEEDRWTSKMIKARETNEEHKVEAIVLVDALLIRLSLILCRELFHFQEKCFSLLFNHAVHVQ